MVYVNTIMAYQENMMAIKKVNRKERRHKKLTMRIDEEFHQELIRVMDEYSAPTLQDSIKTLVAEICIYGFLTGLDWAHFHNSAHETKMRLLDKKAVQGIMEKIRPRLLAYSGSLNPDELCSLIPIWLTPASELVKDRVFRELFIIGLRKRGFKIGQPNESKHLKT